MGLPLDTEQLQATPPLPPQQCPWWSDWNPAHNDDDDKHDTTFQALHQAQQLWITTTDHPSTITQSKNDDTFSESATATTTHHKHTTNSVDQASPEQLLLALQYGPPRLSEEEKEEQPAPSVVPTDANQKKKQEEDPSRKPNNNQDDHESRTSKKGKAAPQSTTTTTKPWTGNPKKRNKRDKQQQQQQQQQSLHNNHHNHNPNNHTAPSLPEFIHNNLLAAAAAAAAASSSSSNSSSMPSTVSHDAWGVWSTTTTTTTSVYGSGDAGPNHQGFDYGLDPSHENNDQDLLLVMEEQSADVVPPPLEEIPLVERQRWKEQQQSSSLSSGSQELSSVHTTATTTTTTTPTTRPVSRLPDPGNYSFDPARRAADSSGSSTNNNNNNNRIFCGIAVPDWSTLERQAMEDALEQEDRARKAALTMAAAAAAGHGSADDDDHHHNEQDNDENVYFYPTASGSAGAAAAALAAAAAAQQQEPSNSSTTTTNTTRTSSSSSTTTTTTRSATSSSSQPIQTVQPVTSSSNHTTKTTREGQSQSQSPQPPLVVKESAKQRAKRIATWRNQVAALCQTMFYNNNNNNNSSNESNHKDAASKTSKQDKDKQEEDEDDRASTNCALVVDALKKLLLQCPLQATDPWTQWRPLFVQALPKQRIPLYSVVAPPSLSNTNATHNTNNNWLLSSLPRHVLLQFLLATVHPLWWFQPDTRTGRSPLHTACWLGDVATVRAILQALATIASQAQQAQQQQQQQQQAQQQQASTTTTTSVKHASSSASETDRLSSSTATNLTSPSSSQYWMISHLNRPCDESGWPCLLYAALAGSLRTVELLLQYGASVSQTTADNQTWLRSNRNQGVTTVQALLFAIHTVSKQQQQQQQQSSSSLSTTMSTQNTKTSKQSTQNKQASLGVTSQQHAILSSAVVLGLETHGMAWSQHLDKTVQACPQPYLTAWIRILERLEHVTTTHQSPRRPLSEAAHVEFERAVQQAATQALWSNPNSTTTTASESAAAASKPQQQQQPSTSGTTKTKHKKGTNSNEETSTKPLEQQSSNACAEQEQQQGTNTATTTTTSKKKRARNKKKKNHSSSNTNNNDATATATPEDQSVEPSSTSVSSHQTPAEKKTAEDMSVKSNHGDQDSKLDRTDSDTKITTKPGSVDTNNLTSSDTIESDPLTVLLMGMGFEQAPVVQAIQALGGPDKATPDTVIAWMLDHPTNDTSVAPQNKETKDSTTGSKKMTVSSHEATKEEEQAPGAVSSFDGSSTSSSRERGKGAGERGSGSNKAKTEAVSSTQLNPQQKEMLANKRKEEQRRRNREWNKKQEEAAIPKHNTSRPIPLPTALKVAPAPPMTVPATSSVATASHSAASSVPTTMVTAHGNSNDVSTVASSDAMNDDATISTIESSRATTISTIVSQPSTMLLQGLPLTQQPFSAPPPLQSYSQPPQPQQAMPPPGFASAAFDAVSRGSNDHQSQRMGHSYANRPPGIPESYPVLQSGLGSAAGHLDLGVQDTPGSSLLAGIPSAPAGMTIDHLSPGMGPFDASSALAEHPMSQNGYGNDKEHPHQSRLSFFSRNSMTVEREWLFDRTSSIGSSASSFLGFPPEPGPFAGSGTSESASSFSPSRIFPDVGGENASSSVPFTNMNDRASSSSFFGHGVGIGATHNDTSSLSGGPPAGLLMDNITDNNAAMTQPLTSAFTGHGSSLWGDLPLSGSTSKALGGGHDAATNTPPPTSLLMGLRNTSSEGNLSGPGDFLFGVANDLLSADQLGDGNTEGGLSIMSGWGPVEKEKRLADLNIHNDANSMSTNYHSIW